MSTTRHIHRRTVICAIVCALLASALANVAPAGASERTLLAGARAHARYYASFGAAVASAGASQRTLLAGARAQGRYYASYGEPQPIPVTQAPEAADGMPWLPITLAVAAAMAVIAAGSTATRRLRLRGPTRVAS
jgi:hypothetical protein